MPAMSSITLNSGFKIPSLGFGTFAIPKDLAEDAVVCAIKAGYRHIDCAMVYDNEEEVGSGISKALLSEGLSRKDLFITSKLWCDKHSPKDVRPACEQSLKRLGLEYLDLYLVHFPTAFHAKPSMTFNPFDRDTVEYEEQSLENTWKAMECLVAAGLVKSIGVSNFNRKQVDRVMSVASIVPAVNQIEVNVDCMNTKLIDYCWSKGIHIEAYGVLGNPGFLGTKVPPILEQPYIKEIAAAHNKTPAQILLRHGLQRGLVVLCKSVTPSRIESNFKVFDFELSEEEMKKLNTCGRNTRLFKVPALKDHPEYPHKEE
uniref:Aldo_ket_red domain-containing protein n=3 Tax=Mesocestoides corti TaxID=53468 RepID=A0A5K3G0T2_MESCO